MLKKNIIAALCIISFALPVVAAEQPNNTNVTETVNNTHVTKKVSWGQAIKKLATSVVLGGVVGAIEGKLSFHDVDESMRFFRNEGYGEDAQFVGKMGSWFITYLGRTAVLATLEKIMTDTNVDADLMYQTARVMSWVSYCMHGELFSRVAAAIPNVVIFGHRDTNGWIHLNN